MKTQTSRKAIWLRTALLLPLLAILIYGFSNTKTIYTEVSSEENLQQKVQPLQTSIKDQTRATKEEMAEYKKLVKHYNSKMPENTVVKMDDVSRMYQIYSKMSPEQKSTADPYPVLPPPPPPMSAEEAKAERFIGSYRFKKPTGETIIVEYDYPNPNILNNNQQKSIPSPPPPPPPPAPIDHIKELAKDGATFYLDDKKITTEKAIEFVSSKKSFCLTTDVENSKPVVRITNSDENKTSKTIKVNDVKTSKQTAIRNFYSVPEAPPTPLANKTEYLKALSKKGATFYIGPHKYSLEEAIVLVEKSNDATIDVNKYPKVYLGGC